MKNMCKVNIKIDRLNKKIKDLAQKVADLETLKLFAKFDNYVDQISKDTKRGCFTYATLSFDDFRELKKLIEENAYFPLNYSYLKPNDAVLIYRNVVFSITLDLSKKNL